MELLETLFGMRIFILFISFSGVFASEENPKVIIVGAGVAGITCASRLLDNGIEDIELLEAEETIGGRTISKQFGEYRVGLGADVGTDEELDAEVPLPSGIIETVLEVAAIPFKAVGMRKRRATGQRISEKSRVSTRVEKIEYDGDGPIRVISEGGEVSEADHVIYTAPLGVLKAEYKEFFSPQLPKKNINAIKNLGYKQKDKIFLYYAEPWWEPAEVDNKRFTWNDGEKKRIRSNSEKSWILGITDSTLIESKPKLLVLSMEGPLCQNMEETEDANFQLQIREFMKSKFPNAITEPTDIMRTFWTTNRNFRGAHSYRSAASNSNHARAQDLGSPIMRNKKPRLQFAGEATDPEKYGTVEGAVSSGVREADRLLAYYNKKE